MLRLEKWNGTQHYFIEGEEMATSVKLTKSKGEVAFNLDRLTARTSQKHRLFYIYMPFNNPQSLSFKTDLGSLTWHTQALHAKLNFTHPLRNSQS